MPSATGVCKSFGLGNAYGDLEPIKGGLSHKLWRLRTETGNYAVKQLDTTVDHARDLAWIEAAFEVERAAVTAAVPAPRPVVPRGRSGCLATVDAADSRRGEPQVVVRVHEWVDGRSLRGAGAMPPELTAQVGRILARLHLLELPAPRVDWNLGTLGEAGCWTEMADRAEQRGFTWARQLGSVAPAAVDTARLVTEAARAPWPGIRTHRDVNQKNVLLDRSGAPIVLDWDVAGPWTATEETAAAALEWAGANVGEPSKAAARALVAGYREASDKVGEIPMAALGGLFVKHLTWLGAHVRRSLDDVVEPGADQEIAANRVPHLIATMRHLHSGIDRWCSWLQ